MYDLIGDPEDRFSRVDLYSPLSSRNLGIVTFVYLHTCADPESFFRGGTILTTFFLAVHY